MNPSTPPNRGGEAKKPDPPKPEKEPEKPEAAEPEAEEAAPADPRIGKVARAIFAAANPERDFGDLKPESRERFELYAKAAIEAAG